MTLHVNHAYLVDFIERHATSAGRFLDYGCGAGEAVLEGRRRGLEFYGAEIFYSGASRRSVVERLGVLGSIIREIADNHAPFPDHFFDIIVNNQLLEHVEDIELLLQEFKRLLKPGGMLLCIYPSRETWREVHVGIPFLHWFRKDNRLRFWYAYMMRLLGMGYHKNRKDRWTWTHHKLKWLDTYTHYRTYSGITCVLEKYFARVRSNEYDYVRFRMRYDGIPFKALLELSKGVVPIAWFVGVIVRRMGVSVLLAEQPQSS